MVDATMPENQEEKDDLFIYTKDLEKELRYYGSFQMMVNDYYYRLLLITILLFLSWYQKLIR